MSLHELIMAFHEPTNTDRAARIDETMEAYRTAQTGTPNRMEDPQDLSDLLADLMHWCKREGVNFEAELTTARTNFEAEIERQAELSKKKGA